MTEQNTSKAECGKECPIATCDRILGKDHWFGDPDGFHSYHTNKHGIARIWDRRDGLTVTPSINRNDPDQVELIE